MKYPRRCTNVTPIMFTPRSAAERSVSTARTPRPPLYVGIACSRQISMEKYAMVVGTASLIRALGGVRSRKWSMQSSARDPAIHCPIRRALENQRLLYQRETGAFLPRPVEG